MTASVRVAPDLSLTTLVSEPERGEGGLASYRGNWGAAFVERIVRWLEPKRVLDPAVGGGTTVAVCQRLGVQVEGYDLNPHPPLGQGGFDMRRDEPAYAPDAILLHPPYGNLVRYSGGVWGERPDPRDLSAIDDWPTFVREMNSTILHLWATLRVHGHMAVLVGDVVRHGAIQSMQQALDRIVWVAAGPGQEFSPWKAPASAGVWQQEAGAQEPLRDVGANPGPWD